MEGFSLTKNLFLCLSFEHRLSEIAISAKMLSELNYLDWISHFSIIIDLNSSLKFLVNKIFHAVE